LNGAGNVYWCRPLTKPIKKSHPGKKAGKNEEKGGKVKDGKKKGLGEKNAQAIRIVGKNRGHIHKRSTEQSTSLHCFERG